MNKYTTTIDSLRDRLLRGKIRSIYMCGIIHIHVSKQDLKHATNRELRKSVVVLEHSSNVITILREVKNN